MCVTLLPVRPPRPPAFHGLHLQKAFTLLMTCNEQRTLSCASGQSKFAGSMGVHDTVKGARAGADLEVEGVEVVVRVQVGLQPHILRSAFGTPLQSGAGLRHKLHSTEAREIVSLGCHQELS